MKYPKLREDSLFVFDGKLIDDPYQWIRDQHGKEILEWVKKENELTDDWFKEHNQIYQKYYQKNLNKKEKASYMSFFTYKDGYTATKMLSGNYYLVKLDKDFKEIGNFDEIINSIENFKFFGVAISPKDENIACFQAQYDGADRPSLLIFNLKKKELLSRIDGVFYFSFMKDSNKVIYGSAKADVKNKITKTFLKTFDTELLIEECLFAYDKNAIDTSGAYYEKDNEIVAVSMADYTHNEINFIKNGNIKNLYGRPALVNYYGKNSLGHILCSFENNECGELISYDLNTDEHKVIFTDKDVYIKDLCLLEDKIYIFGTKDVNAVIYLYENNEIKEIELPNYASCSLLNGLDNNKKELLIIIESFLISPTIYKLEGSKAIKVLNDEEDIDEEYIIKEVFYPSAQDKVLIPCYLIYRKDFNVDGNMATLMYGYGGYALAMTPTYSNPFIGLDIKEWVDEGGLYVHCCLRGGNEYGESWHTAGYKLKKKNCYYDFIGIAEGIIKDGYTNPKRIAINGGSNGGLLMCALLTMRPDLWSCVIASVPHSDMISFVNDDRGPMYITEYGDPHDEEQFDYFLSYSPFHNIKKVEYPSIYIQTGECDNNVPPYHGKKMAARLQQYSTSKNPILLKVLKKGSHDRGTGKDYLETISQMQAFVEVALNK